jgi:ferredoxin-NADP reductase
MRVISGNVDPGAQAGLKATEAALGCFLACQLRPQQDVEVELGEPPAAPVRACVLDVVPLNPEIVRLRLQPAAAFSYRAGQFLRLHRADGASRCYSLASVPGLDVALELHIRRVPGGELSSWVHTQLASGDEVALSAALGASFYLSGQPDRGLCLIGTGCGMAPLYGIARDALHQGHSGPVWLFHGARDASGLYLREQLEDMERRHASFHYVPCVSDVIVPGLAHGRPHDVALERLPQLDGWIVHLCGHAAMVAAARRAAFLAGASMRDIHADPFLPSAPRNSGYDS